MLLENNPYPDDVRVRCEAESLVAAGYDVEVIAPLAPGQLRREVVREVRVRRYRSAGGGGSGLSAIVREYAMSVTALHVAAIRALLRGSAVLHLHNPPDLLFPAAALFRLAGRNVVFDQHDLGPELVAVKLRRRALVALARVAERATFATATTVISPNESYREVALRRGGKSSQQVTVVRNGPPASWLELPLFCRDGVLEDLRLAYVGAVGSQDGLDGMADILAELRGRTPAVNVTLTVIGDGDAREEVQEALRRRGVEDRVTFTGWVASDQVPDLLLNADVCVDPARATDLNDRSTMIKLGEYLALGKPTVAYALTETRRTVGDAGLLVPDGDSRRFAADLVRLAGDPELRRGLAERARERARELTWEHSERELLAAYAAIPRARAARR